MLTGHCLCGSVTFTCDAEPVMTVLCHCEDCQRSSGTAFSTNVVVPKGAFTVRGDALGRFETTGTDTGETRDRQFCTRCGSPIVTFMAEMPDMAVLKAGTLDDRSAIAPAVEVWHSSAQQWPTGAERDVKPRGL